MVTEEARLQTAKTAQRPESIAVTTRFDDSRIPVDINSELGGCDLETLALGDEIDRHPGELFRSLLELPVRLSRSQAAHIDTRDLDPGREAIGRSRESEANENEHRKGNDRGHK